MAGVGHVDAATVTWKTSVVTGDWNTAGNWDRTPSDDPQPGDSVFINSGTQNFWGSSVSAGGMNSSIRNDSTVTINGGSVRFQGNYGANIGTGGTGTASTLTINSGGYYMGGNLNVGNDAGGELGTITVGANGTFDAGNLTWVQMHPTGTITSSGTVVDIGDLDLLGGTVNIAGGTFSVNRAKYESNATKGKKVNISGGALTVGTVSTTELGYGDRYFNFTPGSTGSLILPNVSTTTMSATFLDHGYVRLDGVEDASAFMVSPFGATGSQVSLVPEPSAAAVLGLGIGLLAVRRRRGNLAV
jgi:hypothetical protein